MGRGNTRTLAPSAGRQRGSNLIADWSVEAAHDSPIITLPWEGWVDLHWGATAPNGAKTAGGSPARAKAARTWSRERAATLREAGCYPELLALLKAANHGPIRTAKVDVFPVTRDEVDPEIAETGLSETAYGLGSYLDVLTAGPSFVAAPGSALRLPSGAMPSPASCFALPDFAGYEQVARTTTRTLHAHSLPGACAEIVVRPARLYDEQGFGWTLYAMGFSRDPFSARSTWARAATLLLKSFRTSLRPLLPKQP